MQLLYKSEADTLLVPAALPAAGALPPSMRRTLRWVLYGLLVLGIGLRLFHFFDNRSFFIDELFLNINVIKLNYWQLATEPFAYEQKAPLGYLWATRSLVLLFGPREAALRLFSLLCGVGALLVFVPVARFFLSGWGSVLAVGLLALAYPAVYHSVEAKQYSTELFAAVLCLYWYQRYQGQTSLRAFGSWGVLGGLLLWFSFSAIFVLAGMGATLCLTALWHRHWRRLGLLVLACGLWLVSFGVLYHFFIGKYHDSGWLTYFFRIKYDAFWPVSQPLLALKWLGTKLYEFLKYPLGLLLNIDDSLRYFGFKHFLKMGWLPLPLLGVGTYFLYRKNTQHLLVLLVPVGLALVASAVQKYPFHQRFTLFLAPAVILLLAYGAQQVARRYLRPTARYAFLALSLFAPFVNSAHQVIDTDAFYNREYYRDALFFVNRQYQPGDGVYVYWNMRQAYDYYQLAYPLRYTAVEGSFVKNQSTSQADYLRHLLPDFASFKGKKRLWLIYDVNNRDPIGDYVDQPAWYHAPAYPPGRVLNDHFAHLGKRILHYQKGNYAATLYEFGQ